MRKLKNYRVRMEKLGARFSACRGLSRLYNCVLIGLLALSAVSCRSTKTLMKEKHVERSQIEQADSEVVSISETRIQPVKVPMSAVSLRLNLDSLRLLPSGAGYTARQGQAHVRVSRHPATDREPARIIVEAGCDSLELVCMHLTQTVSVLKKRLARQQYKSELQRQEIKEQSSFSCIRIALKYLLIGIALGFLLSRIKTIISFIKRKIHGK
nr:MAG TPA: hypothetical protein [Caudoviricetes sp.]